MQNDNDLKSSTTTLSTEQHKTFDLRIFFIFTQSKQPMDQQSFQHYLNTMYVYAVRYCFNHQSNTKWIPMKCITKSQSRNVQWNSQCFGIDEINCQNGNCTFMFITTRSPILDQQQSTQKLHEMLLQHRNGFMELNHLRKKKNKLHINLIQNVQAWVYQSFKHQPYGREIFQVINQYVQYLHLTSQQKLLCCFIMNKCQKQPTISQVSQCTCFTILNKQYQVREEFFNKQFKANQVSVNCIEFISILRAIVDMDFQQINKQINNNLQTIVQHSDSFRLFINYAILHSFAMQLKYLSSQFQFPCRNINTYDKKNFFNWANIKQLKDNYAKTAQSYNHKLVRSKQLQLINNVSGSIAQCNQWQSISMNQLNFDTDVLIHNMKKEDKKCLLLGYIIWDQQPKENETQQQQKERLMNNNCHICHNNCQFYSLSNYRNELYVQVQHRQI